MAKKHLDEISSGSRKDGKNVSNFPVLTSLEGMKFLSIHLDDDDSFLQLFAKPVSKESQHADAFFATSEGPDKLDQALLSSAFLAYGDVSVIHSSLISGSESSVYYAIVRFEDRKLMRKALNASPEFADEDEEGDSLGLNKWLKEIEASKVNNRSMEVATDAFMEQYDEQQKEKERQQAELAAIMEADGFTLVQDGPKREREFESDNIKRKKKRGSLELTDFYKYQIAENKLDKLNALRSQFLEDKERIKKMRDQRKFKPF